MKFIISGKNIPVSDGLRTAVEEKLEISDELKENVIEEDLWIEAGTAVGGFSAANEAIGTLVLRFDTQEEMLTQMDRMDELVHVVSE